MADINTQNNVEGAETNSIVEVGGDNNQQSSIQLPQTEDELRALLQKEGDKRVASALKKREEKLKEEYAQKIEEEKAEAAKLAKMTQAEREKVVFEAEKAKFESERQEFLKTQMLNQTMIELQKENLPVSFAKYVTANDAEQVASNINEFKALWQKALQEAVDTRISTKTPKSGTGEVKNLTKEDFQKMNYRERIALLNNNSELYESLNK